MSHVTEMSVNVNPKHIDEFINALKDHFGAEGVEVNLDSPIKMLRWNGESLHKASGSYGVAPECHIVVRRSTQEKKAGHSLAVNDLGYRVNKEENKVDAFIDVSGFSKVDQDNVLMNYGAYVSAKQLKKQGYMLKRVNENGVVKLQAQKYL